MGRSIFISYSRADEAAAHEVCRELEAAGITCWIAPRDIPAGLRYAEGILQGIEDCEVFLLLFSQTATVSPHVLNEIEEAASNSKAMLVVRLDDADPSANRSISLFVRSHQWYDASRGSLAGHTAGLVDVASRLLPAPPVAAPAAPGVTEPEPRRLAIGVDVSATKIRGVVLDLDDPDIYTTESVLRQIPPEDRNARALVGVVQSVVRELADTFVAPHALVGIGLSLPGQVDVRAGTLKFGPNLYGARNIPFKTALAREFPRVAVRVDNDLRCATRTELHLGIGTDFDDFAWIFVGSGVGSAAVINRQILFGHNYCSGEIGHTKLAIGGAPCACGQTGCLETMVKAQAIVDRAHAKAIDAANRDRATTLSSEETSTPEEIVAAIESGDQVAQEVADEVGEILGAGIANYLNLINPSAVVLGGGLMSGFFLHMIGAISSGVQRNALAEVANTPILQSSQPENGMALGAALMFHTDEAWPFP